MCNRGRERSLKKKKKGSFLIRKVKKKKDRKEPGECCLLIFPFPVKTTPPLSALHMGTEGPEQWRVSHSRARTEMLLFPSQEPPTPHTALPGWLPLGAHICKACHEWRERTKQAGGTASLCKGRRAACKQGWGARVRQGRQRFGAGKGKPALLQQGSGAMLEPPALRVQGSPAPATSMSGTHELPPSNPHPCFPGSWKPLC